MSALFNKLVTLCNNKIFVDFNIDGILLIVVHKTGHEEKTLAMKKIIKSRN